MQLASTEPTIIPAICIFQETDMDTNQNTTANASQPANETAQREEDGRFRKGNRGGPGNPFARQMAQLRKAALAAVTGAFMVCRTP